MLTVDLVSAFRKGDRLHLRKLSREAKERVLVLAEAYLDIAKCSLERTLGEFEDMCAAVPVQVQDKKLAEGLIKLVTDRCEFETSADIDPALLREGVFKAASRLRQAAGHASDFKREDALASAGTAFGLSTDEVDALLYADLKNARRLKEFRSISAMSLVELYEKGQGQAVLLKATRVTVHVHAEVATSYRRLFRRLKFLGLLHVIYPGTDGGYRIEIDGPFSMFQSVTKYGLKLALMVPALEECGQWQLDAEVIWGKEKQRLAFHMEGKGQGTSDTDGDEPRLADETARLLERFQKLATPWKASPATAILNLQGVGLCIPDLQFVHLETGEVAYLEVMGFWSRDAVWKRVELVRAGLPHQIIFAVSKSLRVSEQVLTEDLPGALYVYKNVMNPERIESLLSKKVP